VLPLWIAILGLKQIATSAILLQRLLMPPNQLLSLAGQGLVLLAPVFILRGKARLAALLAVDLVLTFVLVLDLVYFRQFADLPSVAVLKYAGLAAKVDGIAMALLRPVDVVLFLSGPVMLAFLHRRVVAAPALRPLRAVALAVAGAVVVLAVALTSKTVRSPVGMRIRVANRLGFIGFHVHDAVGYAGRALAVRRLDRDAVLRDALALLGEREAAAPAPAGSTRGMNVVVVQWESLQGFAGGLTVEGRPVTPNLDRLAAESTTFSRFYSQIGQGNTADAELLAQCSLQPAREGAAFYEYAGTRFRCLPELMGQAGYHTVVMHANDPEFWGRSTTYPAIGFKEFLHVDHFPGRKVGMGTDDRDFFPEAVKRIGGLPQPFYAVLLSLTSHVPFNDVPELRSDLPHGRFAGTTIAHYLDAIHHADAALGAFVDGLRERGLLERTVLVVYGDHWGVSRRTSELGEYLGIPAWNVPRFFLEERRVPMLVRIPGQAPGRIDRAGGQIDLAPTLARLVGVPTPSAAFLGQDLLDGRPRTVSFSSGSALDGERIFLSGDAGSGVEGCYREPGLEKEPLAACAHLRAAAERELRVGWSLLDADLVAQAGDLRAARRQGPGLAGGAGAAAPAGR